MAPFSMGLMFAKIARLQKIKDPSWVFAGPDPPGPPQFSNASTYDMPAPPAPDISAHLNDGTIVGTSCAVGDGMVPGAAGGLIAGVLPPSDAPLASARYGPPAPAWVQRHPRMIHAWAWLRALRWVLRDFSRAFISYLRWAGRRASTSAGRGGGRGRRRVRGRVRPVPRTSAASPTRSARGLARLAARTGRDMEREGRPLLPLAVSGDGRLSGRPGCRRAWYQR
jgi:hypothetical protein